MPSTYGFLSSPQQLPDDCRNEITLEYFMRDSEFIRAIENRTEGTIRYKKDNRVRICSSKKSDRALTDNVFAFTEEERRHFNVLDKFLSELEAGSTIMFNSIKDISAKSEAAVKLYLKSTRKGVCLQFIAEPWLNNDIYSGFLYDYSETNSLIQRVVKATYEGTDAKSSFLKTLSNTESNKAKKNEQGKS